MDHGHIAREWQPRAGNRTISVGSQTTSEEGTNEVLNRKMLREPWTVPFQKERWFQGPVQDLQRQEATVANVSLSS